MGASSSYSNPNFLWRFSVGRLRVRVRAPRSYTAFRPWTIPGRSRGGRVIAFLEDLPLTKGILRGKKMRSGLLDSNVSLSSVFIPAVFGSPSRPWPGVTARRA